MKISVVLLFAALIGGALPGAADERLPVAKYVEYFEIVAFGFEYEITSPKPYIRKWPGKTIKYKMAGLRKEAEYYRPVIERHARVLERFTGVTMKEIPGKAPGEDLIFVFARKASMKDAGRLLEKNERVLQTVAQGRCYFLSYDIKGRIVKGLIAINSELPRLVVEHCLLEEMAQSMGLPNDSPLVSPSLFNDRERQMSLSLIDKVLLRTLYDKRMKPGLPFAQAMITADKIIKGLMSSAKK
jgi:hypothetical protein